jgi:hypothetical protein
MKELTLKRVYLNEKYTIGKLYIDGVYFCDTLEDRVRDTNKDGMFDNGEIKIHGDTAIPYGEYEVRVTYSNHFQRNLPLLLNVPSFEGIRIHRGNTAADTEGCILLGENKIKGKVVNSTPYELELTKKLTEAQKNNKITIKIQ